MTKRLYEVVITCYVMAEDENDACNVAVDNCLPGEAEAWSARDVVDEWADVIPHGEIEGRTCIEIVAEEFMQ